MFCKYCGNQVNDNAIFCSKCGNKLIVPTTPAQTNYISNQAIQNHYQIDEKTKVARKMASHFMISGILLCIFGGINLLMAGLMLLASSTAGIVDEFTKDASDYKWAIFFYIILAVVGFSWAIGRFVGRNKILKTNQYSANGVITSSITLCLVFVLRIITKLNLSNSFGLFFCIMLIAIIIYEIIAIIIYAFINRNHFEFEVHDELDDIPEYVEEPSKWDEILKTEYIEPVDEKEYLLKTYMDYRKDKLVDILDNPNDYQEIAVKVARFVYYNRFCK